MARRTLAGDIGDYLAQAQTQRGWALSAQDGIISTAGILLGFVGAGASEATILVAGKAAIVAGMLTAGGAKWAETAAQREVERQAIAEAREDLRLDRATERRDLIAYYVAKGLDTELAEEVADELMRRSPLKASLEAMHGIARLTSSADVVLAGVGSALAYAVGASIPLAIAWYVPLRIELGLILFAVLVSLILISVAAARAGGMDVRRTMLRTLVVATVTIGVSFAAGGGG
jgi:VIT1/CCC1 family predicted Fe2+/Mn2+ transporter